MASSSLLKTLKQIPKPYSPISPFSTSPPPSSTTTTHQRANWSNLLLFVPGAIAFGLGTWEISKIRDKIEKLEYIRMRMNMERIEFTGKVGVVDGVVEGLEYRRVVCEGVFDEGKSIYLGQRSRSVSRVKDGYFVITPLMPVEGGNGSLQLPVLVNRGWVPQDWRNRHVEDAHGADKPSESEAADVLRDEKSSWWNFWSKRRPTISEIKEPVIPPIRVVGVIWESEKANIFQPANDPSSGQWFYVDVPMIARACGLPENTVYIEDLSYDASATTPYPIRKNGNTLQCSVTPQNHIDFAVKWYFLSGSLTFMAVKRIKTWKAQRLQGEDAGGSAWHSLGTFTRAFRAKYNI